MTTRKHETGACGQGCACDVPSSANGRKARVAIFLVVLLAFAGIAAYKALSSTGKNGSVGLQATFTVAGAAQDAESDKRPPSQDRIEPDKTGGMPEPRNSATRENETTPSSSKDVLPIGVYLESMSELNKVAIDQDAVFILVPSKTDAAANGPILAAVLSAQKKLDPKEFKVGLYTLRTTSPDYPAISSQSQVPAVLVLRKGRGSASVSGEVTETKLLQAFVAASRSGGCCAGAGKARCK